MLVLQKWLNLMEDQFSSSQLRNWLQSPCIIQTLSHITCDGLSHCCFFPSPIGYHWGSNRRFIQFQLYNHDIFQQAAPILTRLLVAMFVLLFVEDWQIICCSLYKSLFFHSYLIIQGGYLVPSLLTKPLFDHPPLFPRLALSYLIPGVIRKTLWHAYKTLNISFIPIWQQLIVSVSE